MTTPTTQALEPELPDLPEAVHKGNFGARYFVAGQMQEYALSAIAADRNKREGATEPERMTIDQSKEFLIKFMERHFTDKTFHRYIRGERAGVNLAGDFAWQLAHALRRIESAAPVEAKASVSAGLSKLLVDVATAVMEDRRLLSRMDDKDTQAFCEELDAEFARALESRLSQQKGAKGWKLVPIEPTPEMIEAGANADPERESVWAAYLAAAPMPKQGE